MDQRTGVAFDDVYGQSALEIAMRPDVAVVVKTILPNTTVPPRRGRRLGLFLLVGRRRVLN
jgi:hypothetical protein